MAYYDRENGVPKQTDNLKINLDDLRSDMANIPQRLHDLSMKVLRMEEKLKDAKVALEEYVSEFSNDVSLNPEKYGFPLGTNVNNFRVTKKVSSTAEYQKLNRTVLYLELRYKQSKILLESTKSKFEALRCLLYSLPK